MKRFSGIAVLLVVLAGGACTEKLATPSDCPELCPGNSLSIRDTILTARVGLDSTFTGYLRADQAGALLVSNGISAGEARTFVVFARRSDSVSIDGVLYPFTIDSVGFVFQLLGRDSLAKNLRLIAHRIPPSVDTTSTFAAINGALTPATLIDSVAVSDTLKTGPITLVVKGDALNRILPIEADSGTLGIGLRVNSDIPTGVRLGSGNGGASAPIFTTYVHAVIADTAKQRQVITLGDSLSNYVIQGPPPPGAGELFLGGKAGSRILLRFTLPKALKDSGAVLRATLELTPVGSLKGLANDPGELQIRGVLVDLGAKSPALASVSAGGILSAGATEVQSIDIRSIVTTWFGPNGLTPSILLGLAPDGGTFSRPEFFSSLAGANTPRLHLTYAVSSHPGNP